MKSESINQTDNKSHAKSIFISNNQNKNLDDSDQRLLLNRLKTGYIKIKMFELSDSLQSDRRNYLKQFDANRTTYIAAEIKLHNPFYGIKDICLTGKSLWFQDNENVGSNDFYLEIKKDWQIVEFFQSWGTPVTGFWKVGEGRIEILIANKFILKHSFLIDNCEVIDFNETSEAINNSLDQKLTVQRSILEKLDKKTSEHSTPLLLSNELDEFIGLKSLKQKLMDFVTYINFTHERKSKGIDSNENLIPHCIFLGGPGTGKTSIARLLGKFYKSIGLLQNGHVIEVDRSALVGEYIGSTAQKTEQVINQALGGILFIDEAYSLKSDNSSKDFGQEAIDIILKRMEDYRGKFVVIAAGYPSLMNQFINSNPGLKSRFSHTFNFEDFSSEELAEIFKKFAAKEKYNLTDEAYSKLILLLDNAVSKTDESLGNARFVRNIFNEAKIQLSKRYQILPYDERNYASLSTIVTDDIFKAFQSFYNQKPAITFNNKVDKYLSEINNLVGLEEVKSSVLKLLSSIKIDALKKNQGIESSSKNLNSIFISDHGLGTSTTANYLAKIYKELNLLSDDQVIEIDNSLFDKLSKIDSYLLVDRLFQENDGKIVLVNDAIKTLDTKKDFSDSLLQYFLKKLYLNQKRIIVILCGSEQEINELIQSVPVIESQFPNVFRFQEQSNRQLLEIGWRICKKKNYVLDEGAWQILYEIICKMRNDNSKVFYNAKTINDILNRAIQMQEKRILSLNEFSEGELMTLTLQDFESLSKEID